MLALNLSCFIYHHRNPTRILASAPVCCFSMLDLNITQQEWGISQAQETKYRCVLNYHPVSLLRPSIHLTWLLCHNFQDSFGVWINIFKQYIYSEIHAGLYCEKSIHGLHCYECQGTFKSLYFQNLTSFAVCGYTAHKKCIKNVKQGCWDLPPVWDQSILSSIFLIISFYFIEQWH